MKTLKQPTFEAMQLAADWIESNDGDEASALKPVAKWLREIAAKQEIDARVRELAVASGISPKELTPSVMRQIRNKLVEKFGHATP